MARVMLSFRDRHSYAPLTQNKASMGGSVGLKREIVDWSPASYVSLRHMVSARYEPKFKPS
jgi:hypothetical protein